MFDFMAYSLKNIGQQKDFIKSALSQQYFNLYTKVYIN